MFDDVTNTHFLRYQTLWPVEIQNYFWIFRQLVISWMMDWSITRTSQHRNTKTARGIRSPVYPSNLIHNARSLLSHITLNKVYVILLGKLAVAKLVKKFLSFSGTQSFITCLKLCNPWAGGPPIIDCPLLLIQRYRSYLLFTRSSLWWQGIHLTINHLFIRF